MTSDQALQRFSLPASVQYRNEIRELLVREIELEKRGESGEEMLRTLCLQLFSLGVAEDAKMRCLSGMPSSPVLTQAAELTSSSSVVQA